MKKLKREGMPTYLHAITTATVCCLIAISSFANNTTAADQNSLILNRVTKDLLDANTPSQAKRIGTYGVALKAKERLAAMLEIINTDPAAVLRIAFSDKVHHSILKNASAYLEEEVRNTEGTFEVLCILKSDSASIFYTLQGNDGKKYIVHFIREPKTIPKTGDKVRIPFAIKVPGLAPSESHLIIPDSGKIDIATQGVTPAFPTTGTFKTLAILVNFQDQPTNKPWTTTAVQNTLAQNVSGFFNENSSHQTSLSVDVAGWFTLPLLSTGTCDTNGILTNAQTLAKAAGINLAAYSRILYVFPAISSCAWAGLGYIGGGPTWGIVWINGYPTQQVMAHELGHNFGLYHAHSRTCTGGPLGSPCTTSEYGDPADTMGNISATHFNAAQKESIGWLDNPNFPPITTIQSSGTYNLEPYETYTMNTKAFRIPKTAPVGPQTEYYYLEYRQPIGYDSTGLNGNLTKGLLLHDEYAGGAGNNSYILNMTPTDTSMNNAAIGSGVTFTDPNAPGGGVAVKVNSVSSLGANVSINFGGTLPTCTHANPTLSVSPTTTQWVNAGGSATYAITLLNNDTSGCATSSFNLTSSAVAGITASLSTAALNVAPGASGNVNVVLQSTTATKNGTYAAGIQAINSSSTTNTAATSTTLGVQSVCVRANPSVAFTPSSQSSTAGAGVSYTLSVTDNDNMACGNSVFNLSAAFPSGLNGGLSQSTLTIAPNSSAATTLQVNSSATTTAGNYNVSATAVNASATSSAATASATNVITSSGSSSYAYTVYLGFPFTPTVLINGSQTCPDPTTHNPACLVSNQVAGSVMTIASNSTNNHKCSLNVQADGSVSINTTASNGCNVGLSPATSTSVGGIALPSGF
jgi:hypothetical protein